MTEELEGRVVTATGVIEHGRVTLDAARIAGVEELAGPAPAGAPTILPGFIDLHCHGGARGSFPSGDGATARRAAVFHRAHGTTTLWASLVSATEAEIDRQVAALSPLIEEGLIDAVHLEGPFINAARCGAQAPSRIQEGDPGMLERILNRYPGLIGQVTFAPETPHAEELAALCARRGVIAALGHTDASAEQTSALIRAARGRGATVSATHLFNAMPPVHHRAPGAAGALLTAAAEGQVFAELVADGLHLADATVDLVHAAAGDQSFAVTDAMEAAGMPDGAYRLGPLDVDVVDSVARLHTADGTPGAIAGGTSVLHQQYLRFAARHGEPAAARLTATTAARLRAAARGHEPDRGEIATGRRADLVTLSPAGALTGIWVGGRPVPPAAG